MFMSLTFKFLIHFLKSSPEDMLIDLTERERKRIINVTEKQRSSASCMHPDKSVIHFEFILPFGGEDFFFCLKKLYCFHLV